MQEIEVPVTFNDGVLALPQESSGRAGVIASLGTVPLDVEMETPLAVSH